MSGADKLPDGCIPIDQPVRRMQHQWFRELYGPWNAKGMTLLFGWSLSEYFRQERRGALRAMTAPPQAYGWTQRRDDELAKALGVSVSTIRRDLKRIDKSEYRSRQSQP